MQPLSSNRPATVDFESRSACDIRAHGSWRYSLDPTTEPLCLAFRLPHWKSGRTALWHPAFPALGIAESDTPELRDLFAWTASGKLVEAHNAFFERGIWTNVMATRFGWPLISSDAWRCSAAKAAAHALPRALADTIAVLGLRVTKDLAGQKLMKKLSKPRKPRKAELEGWLANGQPTLWWESKPWFQILWDYCRQDVLAEEYLSQAIPDLPSNEVALYLLDQAINERGVRLDESAIDTALALIAEETAHLNGEIAAITEGFVTAVTQRQRLLIWLESEGLHLDDTQKQTVEEVLANTSDGYRSYGTLTPRTTRALEILRELGKSSTAKYEKMRAWICPDERVHGSLLYHGASTGRWSGAGIQPQNFPKGTYKDWDMQDAWLYLQHSTRDQLREYWNSVMAPLSQALRGVIIPSDGKTLFVADYASIEARVVLWLAEDEDALQVFRDGGDLYCVTAEEIYGHPVNKTEHPAKRQLGKVACLALFYQMGAGKFVTTAATYGIVIEEDFAEDVVLAFRTKFALVKQMWSDQEAAAIRATERPGVPVVCGRITWEKRRQFLYAKLPSGRELAYPFPQVKTVRTPWDSFRPQLSFMGVNAFNRQWQRQHTYGGSLVENLTQAVARDCMAHAMQHVAASNVYQQTLSVHDEIVCEGSPDMGSVEDFTELVTRLPDWANGLPVAAESWTGMRYHK